MLTFILRILYNIGLLRKAKPGYYFCDPEMLSISRICFRYIPILGKRTDDTKNYCGDWHRVTLIRWQIEYLIYKRPKKIRVQFP